VELTEDVLVADVAHTLAARQELGLGVVVHGPGTGAPPCSTLAHVPVDAVTIDGSRTAGIGDPDRRRESSAVANASSAPSPARNVSVVADGIETSTPAETLHGLGCDHQHGSHSGYPNPADPGVRAPCAGGPGREEGVTGWGR
jgi:EAL domain-containing protein (putative c-di-GMP-specific phosphodiesterase class I)